MSTTREMRYLGELAAMNSRQDTARHQTDNSQFVPVDFKRLIIHDHRTSYEAWAARGYRLFHGCMPVRTDYINEQTDLFSVFVDERR